LFLIVFFNGLDRLSIVPVQARRFLAVPPVIAGAAFLFALRNPAIRLRLGVVYQNRGLGFNLEEAPEDIPIAWVGRIIF
jgi:hypothetical protein